MITFNNERLSHLNDLSAEQREQQRMQAIATLRLLNARDIPVFEEATKSAAQFLDTPIGILSVITRDQQQLLASVGISKLGFLNPLSTTHQFPRLETFCHQVVESHQPLVLEDALSADATFANRLIQQYGIRSYVGVPLLESGGACIGTLAVMDVKPHSFMPAQIQFLELTARWCMSEYERRYIATLPAPAAVASAESVPFTSQLRLDLLGEMAQELRTPLTSVMGMTRMLMREIYGPLTQKQREYLDIIHTSGDYLLSLVNELVELAGLKSLSQELKLASVDVEMICQQALNTLKQAVERREQEIRLSIEPGRRIWFLDKDRVRQMIYHLVFTVIQSSTTGSLIRLHVSRRNEYLNLSVWVSHPWLGDGLPFIELPMPETASVSAIANGWEDEPVDLIRDAESSLRSSRERSFTQSPSGNASTLTDPTLNRSLQSQLADSGERYLGLQLCRHLAQTHGGDLQIQGNGESGYRYVISLPQVPEPR